jgi:phytol kinase
MDPPFLVSQVVKVAALAGIAYAGGLLVRRFDVLVNYTRKINHFALYCIPQLIDVLFEVTRSAFSGVVNGLATVAMFILFWKPIRGRLSWAQTMFLSWDRPEDRPNTLKWLVSQFLVSLLVLIPMLFYFRHFGFAPLSLMVVLIAIVGDGLAEPVGVRYGHHKYSVPALFTRTQYVRSYAGSACVFVVSTAGILLFHDAFTTLQLVIALLWIPIAMTIAEAVSPHTWDSPLLFFAGAFCVAVIKQLVP